MRIKKSDAVRYDWDEVDSWNYKLTHLAPYQSVVYAELKGDHTWVETTEVERIYFIIEGEGEFEFNGENHPVISGDVFTIPPNTKYDYRPTNGKTMKILLLMELWDNKEKLLPDSRM